MKKVIPWLAATAFIAIAVHIASLYAIPPLAMMRVLERAGPANTMTYVKRPDASWHFVKRPSADLLYAECPYDLSGGSVVVTSPVPVGTWWSVAVYDASARSVFAADERQARSRFRLVIAPGGSVPGAGAGNVAISPTNRGIVIIRTFIDSEAHLAALDALRRQSRCSSQRLNRSLW
ncbi:MAG: DUF1254 domain-containing protein [Rhizomicrobium sp.]